MIKKTFSRKKNVSQEGGYVILMAVLIVGAAALSIVLSIVLTGIDSNTLSGIFQSSKISQNVADACAEQALQKLKLSSSYTGNETLTFPRGETCTILTVEGTGTTNRTLKITANAGSMIRKVQILVATTSPQMVLTSWSEVGDFY